MQPDAFPSSVLVAIFTNAAVPAGSPTRLICPIQINCRANSPEHLECVNGIGLGKLESFHASVGRPAGDQQLTWFASQLKAIGRAW